LSSVGVSDRRSVGRVLGLAIFATGCAGLVAEFVLSTLATYLAGNAVFQWTLVMSLMLFAMGIGSRISRVFTRDLLDAFILTEFTLSALCASCAVLTYGLAGASEYTEILIYSQAVAIGTLIGFEIPLVTRLNEHYEELRINISSVMEKDYYGSLLGGMIFAFFALPRLGLTYTPILLGTVNFCVAGVVLWRFQHLLGRQRLLKALFAAMGCYLIALFIAAEPIVLYGEQKKYRDKVIYSEQTPYQKIVMTQWKSHFWLFLNGQEQFSTYDEERYHEPLVHPAMCLSSDRGQVLIIGGGDGLAAREALKHPDVSRVTLVDMDPAMTRMAREHPILLEINRGALNDPRVSIVNQDAAEFVDRTEKRFGVIIVDLPDPDTVDLMHVYSEGFYRALNRLLIRGGVMVTQATSPYFSPKAFRCILKTIRSAGFTAIALHNQIPTMGEWGWVIGISANGWSEEMMANRLTTLNYSIIDTKFLNADAVVSMLHFGKGILEPAIMDEIRVNTERNPVLHRYYSDGNWGIY